MPTSWKRTPEELHSIYCSNTEAFYRVAGRGLAPQLDGFVRSCTLGLWSHSASITQEHVDAFNQLYSKGQVQPNQLLWGLTGEICKSHDFLPASVDSGNNSRLENRIVKRDLILCRVS